MKKKNPIYGQGSYGSENQEVDPHDPWHERYKYGPHYHRGPRAHQRGDDKIWEDICDALANASDVNASEMEVDVEKRVVSLSGVVHTREEAWRAEKIVWDISGVEKVKNNIEIKYF